MTIKLKIKQFIIDSIIKTGILPCMPESEVSYPYVISNNGIHKADKNRLAYFENHYVIRNIDCASPSIYVSYNNQKAKITNFNNCAIFRSLETAELIAKHMNTRYKEDWFCVVPYSEVLYMELDYLPK